MQTSKQHQPSALILSDLGSPRRQRKQGHRQQKTYLTQQHEPSSLVRAISSNGNMVSVSRKGSIAPSRARNSEEQGSEVGGLSRMVQILQAQEVNLRRQREFLGHQEDVLDEDNSELEIMVAECHQMLLQMRAQAGENPSKTGRFPKMEGLQELTSATSNSAESWR